MLSYCQYSKVTDLSIFFFFKKAWSGELVLKQRTIFNFLTRSSSNRDKLASKENSKHDT